jgi:nitrate/nitrite transport system substrate-binding protein
MPYLMTAGKITQNNVPVPIHLLARLNYDCQAISISNEYKDLKVGLNAAPLKAAFEKKKAVGKPVSVAMTFPGGTHDLWIRYWLAAGGIDPDRDISTIVVPPPQMVANMKIGKMDGFCVGEPWNARLIADGIGFTSLNTQDIWKDHPEKVCAFTAEFADKNPKAVKAVLKALHEASVWLDKMENRPEQAEIVSRPTYINCPKEIILGRMLGDYDFGDGRKKKDPNYMIFHDRNCNYPQSKYAVWWLTQFRRWGMVTGAPDYEGVARQVMRPDLYEEAMKEIGYQHGGPNKDPETLFDGLTFDPAKPEDYAKGFPVNNLKG